MISRSRLAVLGHPIAHSFSPLLHQTAARVLGLDWSYTRFDVTEPELPGFVQVVRTDWLGLSLTMPLKRTILPLLDQTDSRVQSLGVANTIRFDRGRILGANTDVLGFSRLIEQSGTPNTLLLLGSGATALSALAAAAERGIQEIAAAVRTPAHATRLRQFADDHGLRLSICALTELSGTVPAGTLTISTLPPGAGDSIRLKPEASGQTLLDAAYGAHDLPLADRWRDAGGTALDGTALLIEQAIPQDAFFLGRDPETHLPEEGRLRSAMHAALGR